MKIDYAGGDATLCKCGHSRLWHVEVGGGKTSCDHTLADGANLCECKKYQPAAKEVAVSKYAVGPDPMFLSFSLL